MPHDSLKSFSVQTVMRHKSTAVPNSPRRLPMKYLIRVTIIGLMGFWVLVLAINSWAQQRDPIIEKVAKAYGVDSYDTIEAVRYTWSIDIPGLFKATHKWEWEPKTGKISFETTDKDGKPVKVSYDSS